MINKINTQSPTHQEPAAHRNERKSRAPLVVINAAAALLLAACGSDQDPASANRAAESGVSAPTSTSAEATTQAPVPTTPQASPTTEAAPNASLQEQMVTRAGKGASELSQSIVSLAATLPPESGYVEPAGDDGSLIQHANVDVSAQDGTVTHYELYTQYQDPGAGVEPVIQSVTLEVDYKDATGNITDTPYWLTVMKDATGTGQQITVSGFGEGGPFDIADDFAGEPGLDPGKRPIMTLEDEEAVFAQANRVISDARNGVYNHGESSPF